MKLHTAVDDIVLSTVAPTCCVQIKENQKDVGSGNSAKSRAQYLNESTSGNCPRTPHQLQNIGKLSLNTEYSCISEMSSC